MINSTRNVKYTISLVLIALIFIYLSKNIASNWQEIHTIAWYKLWPTFLLSLSAYFIVQFLLVYAWHLILRKQQELDYNKKDLIHCYFLPAAGKYLPGKILFVIGRIELLKNLGISRTHASTLFFLETFLLLSTAAILSISSLLTSSISFLSLKLPALNVNIFFISLCLFFIGLFIAKKQLKSSYQKLSKVLTQKFKEIHQHLKLPLSSYALILSNYLLLWIIYGSAGLITTSAFIDIANLDIHQIFLIGSSFIAAWLLGMLAVFTPSGLGVREGSLVILLSPILSTAEASAIAIIMRLFWTISEFSLVGAASLVPPRETKPAN